jgi:hypothetical protein
MADQPNNNVHFSAVGGRGVGPGGGRRRAAPPSGGRGRQGPDPASSLAAAATSSLTLDFAYMCLNNAESLLPSSEEAATSGVFCGYCSR